MTLALTLALPRFIVLRSDPLRNNCMSYVHEKENSEYGYLQFNESEAENPYAKFEVKPADIDGLVHIRSSRNNKYLERTNNVNYNQHYITATATKPENDQSKESCTLFKSITVDAANNTISIMHVQSGCYLRTSAKMYVVAEFKVPDDNRLDIFEVIDWNSLVILPRYLAFKGANDQFLRLIPNSYLQFSASDIDDSTATFERFSTSDGILRIKSTSNGKFWRGNPNWILADSDDTSNNNTDTLFRPIKIDDYTISLLNLGNNQFCKRLTTVGFKDCLSAYASSTTKEVKLTVEEPVSKRNIYVKYDPEDSIVYDETVHVMANSSVTNNGQQDITYEMKLPYTVLRTSTWNTMFSLKLEMKANLNLTVPLIDNGGHVEMSDEVQSGVKWGETTQIAIELEFPPHNIVVPPMTKVTVYLVATKGKCDVPFTFIQDDMLYNGETVTTEVQGGTYTGSDYYNFHIDTKEENI